MFCRAVQCPVRARLASARGRASSRVSAFAASTAARSGLTLSRPFFASTGWLKAISPEVGKARPF